MRKTTVAAGRVALSAALAVLITAVTIPAHALGLGRLSVNSALGQPLQAEIELTAVTPEEEATLKINLAPDSAYRESRLERNPALTALRFDLERRGSSVIVKISSLQPITEPYLDLIVEAAWANGKTRREYTVLLDPPALRQLPQGLPPMASAPAQPAPPATQNLPPPVPAQVPAEAARPSSAAATAAETQPEPAARPAPPPPAPAPAAAATVASAPAVSAPAGGATEYEVKPGDTAGQIARQFKPTTVSLDQMLVALVRSNPQAFADGNMNRLFAGRRLSIPAAEAAAAIPQAEARAEFVAQSRDFAEYRSRLAQRVDTQSVAATPPPAATAQGRVTPRVEDKAAAPKSGDRLTIAKAEAGANAAAAAVAKADEAAAQQRALKEQQERAAELQKTNDALKKALELQSKAGAEAQRSAAPAAEPKAADAAKPAGEPKADATKVDAAKPDPAAAAVAKSEPAPAPPAVAANEVAPKPAADPVPAPAPAPAPPPAAAPKKAAPPPPPPPSEPGFLGELLGNTMTQIGLGLLVVLIVGWAAYSAWRKRRVEQREEFQATTSSTTLGTSSLFRASGGRSVDTGSVSTFNSSFIPGASQFTSNEVDPVAEADVYVAYGREEQAEEILKEALRLQPDRHAARLKLLEIYSRRGDRGAFSAALEQLRQQTGGAGDDWERAVQLARAQDPTRGSPAPEAVRSASAASAVEGIAAAYANVAPEASAALAAQSAAERAAQKQRAEARPDPAATAPLDFAASRGPQTKFEATFGVSPQTEASPDPWRVMTKPVDFSALDFDLKTPTTMSTGNTQAKPVPAPPPAVVAPKIPDVDLNLAAPAPATVSADPQGPATRSTVFGVRDTSLPQGPATDQLTVPMIDFDLGNTTLAKGVNTGTKSGSPLASQMATKLDLARGYVELGVRDGARELLEEVMRDGTAEQRADAVELLRTIEA